MWEEEDLAGVCEGSDRDEEGMWEGWKGGSCQRRDTPARLYLAVPQRSTCNQHTSDVMNSALCIISEVRVVVTWHS